MRLTYDIQSHHIKKKLNCMFSHILSLLDKKDIRKGFLDYFWSLSTFLFCVWLDFYDRQSYQRYKKHQLFLSLLLKISVDLTETDFSKQRMMYILQCLTTYVSKQLRRSPSRVLGSKGSLNDPVPSVSLGQGGEPHERTIKISLKEEEKKGWVSICLSTDMILKPSTQSQRAQRSISQRL